MRTWRRIILTKLYIAWMSFIQIITFWDFRLKLELKRNGPESEKAAKIAFEGVDIVHMGNSIRFVCAVKKIFDLTGKKFEESNAYYVYAHIVQNKPLHPDEEHLTSFLNFQDRPLSEGEIKQHAFNYVVACGDFGRHAVAFYSDLNTWLNTEEKN